MACPTCSKTMHSLGNNDFWCPCCGTIKNVRGYSEDISIPSLVTCFREFITMISDNDTGRYLKKQLEISGILEAIKTEEERK